MNNATSKFGTWDHYSFSFLSVRSGATIFPRLGEGWRVRRMIVRSETSRKLLRSEPSSHWGRHIHHSLLMPRNSHISGWRTPWRGLFLASFILSFSLSLSLSRNQGGQASYINHERLTRDSREEGLESESESVMERGESWEMCTLPCYILGDETGEGRER